MEKKVATRSLILQVKDLEKIILSLSLSTSAPKLFCPRHRKQILLSTTLFLLQSLCCPQGLSCFWYQFLYMLLFVTSFCALVHTQLVHLHSQIRTFKAGGTTDNSSSWNSSALPRIKYLICQEYWAYLHTRIRQWKEMYDCLWLILSKTQNIWIIY